MKIPVLLIRLLILVFFTLPATGLAQLKYHDFQDLERLSKSEPRQVVVFIHTDWCKFCQQMEHTSLVNDSVVDLLNREFYFVRLNAENKNSIKYLGHVFRYKPTGGNTGVHELAVQLGSIDGKMNYPTLSVLNTKNEITFQNGGLMNAQELLILFKALLKK